MKEHIVSLSALELASVRGGEGAIATFGAQLASDGLNHANSGNPVVAAGGLYVAAAGGWIWAIGEFVDGVTSLFR